MNTKHKDTGRNIGITQRVVKTKEIENVKITSTSTGLFDQSTLTLKWQGVGRGNCVNGLLAVQVTQCTLKGVHCTHWYKKHTRDPTERQ